MVSGNRIYVMYFAHDVVMYYIGTIPWYHGDSPIPLESAVRGLVSLLFSKFPKIFLLLLYCLKNKTKVFKLNYTRVYGNSVIRGNNGITPLSKIYCPLPFKLVKKINNSLLMPTSSLTPCLLRSNYLRKLFDIRFSYKHCNFSRICLLVKMPLKTVTRSIRTL